MSDIRVSITDHGNQEIVDTVKLSRYISKNDLSIDGEKLYGSDNFIIDARRLKCNVKLGGNTSIDNDLVNALTDEDNLVLDSLDTEEHYAFMFTDDKINELYADEKYWYSHFNWEDNQTWSPSLVDSGIFIPQSRSMLNLMLSMLVTESGAFPFPGQSFDGNYKKKINNTDYTFRYGLKNIIGFLARGMQMDNNLPYSNTTDPTNMFITYLNDIYGSMGTELTTYIYNKAITHPHSSARLELKHLFEPMYVGSRRNLQGVLVVLGLISEWLGQNSGENGLGLKYYNPISVDNWVKTNFNSTVQYTSWNNELRKSLAVFFSSIIKYEWFTGVKNDYFQSLNVPPRVGYPPLNRDEFHCLPFNQIYEVVGHQNFNYPGALIDLIWQSSGVEPVLCLNRVQSNLIFGKTQRETVGDTTQSGMKVVKDNLPDGLAFIPVKREYYRTGLNGQISEAPYKFFIDGINFSNIYSQTNNSIISVGGWDSTNWIYFDRMRCKETYSPDTQFSDNIPVYDEQSGSQTDDYGLYVYDDYFEKYYTKEKSKLMNLYVKVYMGNTQIYHGIIDFTSVSHDGKQLSFEAIDATGVLIENLTKLSSFVSFSQFDTGDRITADLRAGTNIRRLIEDVIKIGIPYRTNLTNPTFTLSNVDGLNNKLLNDINADVAFLAGLQISKQMISTDGSGKITLSGIDFESTPININDKSIIDISNEQGIDTDIFRIDKISNIAGHKLFAPSVASFFNSIRKKYNKTININLLNNQTNSNINILDRLSVSNIIYIVVQKEFDIMGNKISLTCIKE